MLVGCELSSAVCLGNSISALNKLVQTHLTVCKFSEKLVILRYVHGGFQLTKTITNPEFSFSNYLRLMGL